MSEILSKISSYNIINYIIPGGIFTYFSADFFDGLVRTDDTFLLIFFMYFIGMCISRIGSIALEPMFKMTKFIENEPYSDYLDAFEKDGKISELLETSSLYRTISSGFAIFSILFITINIYDNKPFYQYIYDSNLLISILLFLLFSFSYRKQTKYIAKRIRHYSQKI